MAETYYKYMDVRDMSRIATIIREHKLWATTYKDLNDPMECFFRGKDKNFDQGKLYEYKRNARICSVSKSKNYGLMWSMYANGYRGICLEFSIDDTENCKENEPLSEDYWRKYTINYKNAPTETQEYPSIDEILGVKSPQWIHEQEVRFVRKCNVDIPCFLKIKISKIYFGTRMAPENKAIIYGLKAYLDYDFEIIDLASINMEGIENVGINYWNDYKDNAFPRLDDKRKIGFAQ